MLLGPCLAAITAPAAAPDMMEFQGSWLREEVQDHFKYKKAKMNLFSSDVGECAVKRGETNTPSCELTTKERSSAKVIYNLTTYIDTSTTYSTRDISGDVALAPTFLSPWWCLPWASSDSQLEHCRRLQACWKNHHLKTPSASLRWARGFKINLWVPWRRHHHNHQWSSKGKALLHILPSSFCKTTVFSKASQTKWLLWGYFLWICLSGHQGPLVSKAMYFWASLSLTEPARWCVIMLCNNI